MVSRPLFILPNSQGYKIKHLLSITYLLLNDWGEFKSKSLLCVCLFVRTCNKLKSRGVLKRILKGEIHVLIMGVWSWGCEVEDTKGILNVRVKGGGFSVYAPNPILWNNPRGWIEIYYSNHRVPRPLLVQSEYTIVHWTVKYIYGLWIHYFECASELSIHCHKLYHRIYVRSIHSRVEKSID